MERKLVKVVGVWGDLSGVSMTYPDSATPKPRHRNDSAMIGTSSGVLARFGLTHPARHHGPPAHCPLYVRRSRRFQH